MNKKKKNPFDKLEEGWKDMITSYNEQEIRNAIAEIALTQSALLSEQSEDQDLKEKKEVVKDASEVYREGTKLNKLKIAFARQVLADRGKA